jgi:hypothetical protein
VVAGEHDDEGGEREREELNLTAGPGRTGGAETT